jgi:hypothetical protein
MDVQEGFQLRSRKKRSTKHSSNSSNTPKARSTPSTQTPSKTLSSKRDCQSIIYAANLVRTLLHNSRRIDEKENQALCDLSETCANISNQFLFSKAEVENLKFEIGCLERALADANKTNSITKRHVFTQCEEEELELEEEVAAMKVAVNNQTIAIKALATQLAQKHSGLPAPAIQISKASPTLPKISYAAAASKAKIVISSSNDKALDKEQLCRKLRAAATCIPDLPAFSMKFTSRDTMIMSADKPEDLPVLREAIKESLDPSNFKLNKVLKPRVVVLRIDNDTKVDDIKEALGAQHNIADNNISLVNTVPNKSFTSYNAFFDLPAEAFKKIFKEGQFRSTVKANFTVFSMEIAKINNICFKCGQFGHLIKFCDQAEKCTHCCGEHQFKDCPTFKSVPPKCLHCKEDRNHSCLSMKCPIYRRHFQKGLEKMR